MRIRREERSPPADGGIRVRGQFDSELRQLRRGDESASAPRLLGRHLEHARHARVRPACRRRQMPAARLWVLDQLSQAPVHLAPLQRWGPLGDHFGQQWVREPQPSSADEHVRGERLLERVRGAVRAVHRPLQEIRGRR